MHPRRSSRIAGIEQRAIQHTEDDESVSGAEASSHVSARNSERAIRPPRGRPISSNTYQAVRLRTNQQACRDREKTRLESLQSGISVMFEFMSDSESYHAMWCDTIGSVATSLQEGMEVVLRTTAMEFLPGADLLRPDLLIVETRYPTAIVSPANLTAGAYTHHIGDDLATILSHGNTIASYPEQSIPAAITNPPDATPDEDECLSKEDREAKRLLRNNQKHRQKKKEIMEALLRTHGALSRQVAERELTHRSWAYVLQLTTTGPLALTATGDVPSFELITSNEDGSTEGFWLPAGSAWIKVGGPWSGGSNLPFSAELSRSCSMGLPDDPGHPSPETNLWYEGGDPDDLFDTMIVDPSLD